MKYRDYLIWTAARTASALTDALWKSATMKEEAAILTLETTLSSVGVLADFRNASEVVDPRPEMIAR